MSKQFSQLGIIEPLLRSLSDSKISIPTDIQQKSIPFFLKEKNDLVGLAKTGTGKTAAFGLPLLQLVDQKQDHIQVVILAPTRELGQQIYENLISFATYLPEISIASICGGVPIKPQIERLTRTTHIIVATPGRLIDLIQRKAIDIKRTGYLVLDEADEMLSSLKDGLDIVVAELPRLPAHGRPWPWGLRSLGYDAGALGEDLARPQGLGAVRPAHHVGGKDERGRVRPIAARG